MTSILSTDSAAPAVAEPCFELRGLSAISTTDPVLALLRLARSDLAEASAAPTAVARFRLAYRCALRSAASVLALRARPDLRAGGRVRNVWTVLADLAPELGEWADFFATVSAAGSSAAGSGLGSATDSVTDSATDWGDSGAVTWRRADDLVRDAESFLRLVQEQAVAASLPGAAASVTQAPIGGPVYA